MAKQITSMSELAKEIQKRINRGDPTIMKQIKNSKGQTFEQVSAEEMGRAANALKGYLRG